MSEWRRSSTVALTTVALFVVVQLAIPLSRLNNEGLQRFGWQMYSTVGQSIEFTVQIASGSEVVDLKEYMARVRLDLPLEQLMPPHLCVVIPGAESVTWDDSVYTC